jgi:thymidylate kinase
MSRIEKEKSKPELFERKDFLNRAREGYLKNIKCFREVKVFRIDGRKSPENVFSEIKEKLEKFL